MKDQADGKLHSYGNLATLLVCLWLLRAFVVLFFSEPLAGIDTLQNYIPLARNLLAGNGYSYDLVPPYVPTALRLPGYPLFLAAAYCPFSTKPWIAVVLQIFTEGIATWVLYRTFRRLTKTWKYGKPFVVTATLLYILWPYSICYTGILIRESLFSSFLTMAFCAFFLAMNEPRLKTLLLSTAAFAVAFYFREDTLHFFMIALVLWALRFRHTLAATLKQVLLAMALFGLFASPWVVRNYMTFHRWILVGYPSFSVFMILGNVDGWREPTEGQEKLLPVLSQQDRQTISAAYADLEDFWKHNGHPQRYDRITEQFRPLVFKYLRAYPFQYAELCAKHFLRYTCSSRIDMLPTQMHPERVKWFSSLFHGLIYLGGVVGFVKSAQWRFAAPLLLYVPIIVAISGNLNGRYEASIVGLLCLGCSLVFFEKGSL